CSSSLLIRRHQRARCQAETPLTDLFKFAEPALTIGMLCPMSPPICFSSMRNLLPSRAPWNSHSAASRSNQVTASDANGCAFSSRAREVSPIEHLFSNQVPIKESQVILATQVFRLSAPQKMWVIVSFVVCVPCVKNTIQAFRAPLSEDRSASSNSGITNRLSRGYGTHNYNFKLKALANQATRCIDEGILFSQYCQPDDLILADVPDLWPDRANRLKQRHRSLRRPDD
ncbi:hypothetical protein ABIB82_007538, partial [Bradyrhizobium sp. i1.8.4]